MKRFVICGAMFLSFPSQNFAQTTPLFEMPLYFEDAAGNRDTLIIGYDTMALGSLHPILDGAEITGPFDSIFEVRAFHLFDWFDGDLNIQMSKKIIADCEWSSGLPCGVSNDLVILMSCKYPPITITYDSTRLTHPDSCRGNTILTRDWLIFFLQYWWDAGDWRCMGATSRITDDLQPVFYQGFYSLTVEAEVEGKGIQELPGFFIEFRDWGPCTDSTILSMTAPPPLQPLRIFPNPTKAGSELILDMPDTDQPFHIEIQNMTGVSCKTAYWPANAARISLPTTDLAPGLYAVTMRDADGRLRALAKFIMY